jgi:hypothetical protein
MKLVKDAPNRSAWSFSQNYRGSLPQFVFLGQLIVDAFRAFRARTHSR